MAKLLDFTVRCRNVTDDELVENIERMADPDSFDSRDELSSYLDEYLGYNPIDYFDRKSIEEQFDEIVENAPYSVREQLRDKHDEIIERTLECNDDVRETILRKVFVSVIKDTVGWQPTEDDDVSVDDSISMAVFNSDEMEDSNDYDPEDSDDEEDDLYSEDEDYDESSDYDDD